MRLVICHSCGRLSEVHDGLGGIHACACVPDTVMGIMVVGAERYRELDKHEAKSLAAYVAQAKEPAQGEGA